MCWPPTKAHGTPDGVRTLSRLDAIDMELLTEFARSPS